jgi:hypothetical protein|eukprot:2906532-Prymnesium_polylepis.2
MRPPACTGLAWAALSAVLASGWPVLCADGLAMLASGLVFTLYASGLAGRSTPLLWLGTLLLSVGFASSLPCALTLPAEAGLTITPPRLLALNLAGSAGEMFIPFAISMLFGRGWYGAFGPVVVVLQLVVLGATGVAWAVSRGGRRDGCPPSVL